MPFQLRNAAQMFQCFMDQVLCGLDFYYTYIDDILIASKTTRRPQDTFTLCFEYFVTCGILINPVKCVLGVSQLHFLGHHIDSKGATSISSMDY